MAYLILFFAAIGSIIIKSLLLFIIFIVIFLVKMIYDTSTNEIYSKKIIDDFDKHQCTVNDYGFIIKTIAPHDCAPCEIYFDFIFDDTIIISLYGRKAYRLLKKIENCEDISKMISKKLKNKKRFFMITNYFRKLLRPIFP